MELNINEHKEKNELQINNLQKAFKNAEDELINRLIF